MNTRSILSSLARPSARFERGAPRAQRGSLLPAVLLALSLSVAAACGDDDNTNTTGDGGLVGRLDAGTNPGLDATTPATPDGAAPTTPVPTEKPLYVLASAVSVGDTSTTYVKSLEDVDSTTKIDLKNTLEQAGFGDILLLGGKLYVSGGEAATVARYVVGADGSFTKDGSINFSTYSTTANLYDQSFVSPTKAVLKAETQYVFWNPTTLKIEGAVPLPTEIAPREGLNPFYSYDRAFHARGNRVYQSVSYLDYVNFKMTASSSIVVIDTDNNKVLSVLEAPCPSLDTATEDAAGNIYFSPWVYGPGATIINGAAAGCAVKIPAGSDTLDPTFKLTFKDITGGHEAAAFRSLGGSKYLMSVFHEEKKAYDPSKQKISEWLFSDSWAYATYDLVTKEYKEIAALGASSGGYYSSTLGDKFYILSPSSDYSSTTYKQLLADGTVKTGISMDGWSTKVYQVK